MGRSSIVVIALMGCTSSSPEPTSSRPGEASPSKPAPTKSAPDPDDAKAPKDCDGKLARYLEERKALNRCERDSDCSEIWPGVCPHGPYYIHRESELGALQTLVKDIEATCILPECEPPTELGIARCEAGQCVEGRTAPVESDDESCWDYREEYLEGRGGASGRTFEHVQGITPRLVLAPKQAGTATLVVEWPAACSDCRLDVSEHNSGMANLVDTKPTQSEAADRHGEPIRRDTIELKVTPGPYYIIGRAKVEHIFVLRTELSPDEVTMHGVAWPRLCEG